MKHLILTTALICAITCVKSQSKPKTDTTAKKYAKVVQIPLSDFQTLTGLANQLRNLTPYIPELTADDKVKQQVGIDGYLGGLSKRLKVDSVLIK